MTKDPVVITVDLGDPRPIAEQMDTPEHREAIAGIVRDAIDPPPSGGFWGEVPTGPAEPIAFQTARKDLLRALTNTQHALSGAEDRPVLQSWWLTVEGDTLTVHASDNYRVARATLPVIATAPGTFAIHRSEGKALLAFLASGPSEVAVDVAGGTWSVTHAEGRLAGRLSPGEPPDWSKVTAWEEPTFTVALNGKYAAEAARAAVGESGVMRFGFVSDERPVTYRSQGYDEWVMPVRTPGEVPA